MLVTYSVVSHSQRVQKELQVLFLSQSTQSLSLPFPAGNGQLRQGDSMWLQSNRAQREMEITEWGKSS